MNPSTFVAYMSINVEMLEVPDPSLSTPPIYMQITVNGPAMRIITLRDPKITFQGMNESPMKKEKCNQMWDTVLVNVDEVSLCGLTPRGQAADRWLGNAAVGDENVLESNFKKSGNPVLVIRNYIESYNTVSQEDKVILPTRPRPAVLNLFFHCYTTLWNIFFS